jgi:hypothetical protein
MRVGRPRIGCLHFVDPGHARRQEAAPRFVLGPPEKRAGRGEMVEKRVLDRVQQPGEMRRDRARVFRGIADDVNALFEVEALGAFSASVSAC